MINWLLAWGYFLVFYIPDRRHGWSHEDLVFLRELAIKYG